METELFDWLRSGARRLIPPGMRHSVGKRATRATLWPQPGMVRFGSLRRLTPVSGDWGFDRGTPIDRYYIEQFMEAQSEHIRGSVLEIDTNRYTSRFGGDQVEKSDVLHIAEMGPGITMVGDLSNGDHLPSDTFDCVIVTQTLQLIYEVDAAVRTIHRMLKPGGSALITVPGLTKMTADPEGKWGHFWSFTSLSARRMFEDLFPGGTVHIDVHGNVLTGMSFLHGLAAEELTEAELEHHDPDMEVLLTIRAVKAENSG
jgi:SAM-dependent methyltransferase